MCDQDHFEDDRQEYESRGMVTRRVETYCREKGITRVTATTLAEIRARMPTPKLFSR